MRKHLLRLNWAASFCAVALAYQTQTRVAPSVSVVEPATDSHIAGETRLLAEVRPEETKPVRVEFFVDGVRVCRCDRRPFDCVWDAGTGGTVREISAVAILEDGTRLTDKVRTKALEYVESVRVRSVLVPAVVTDSRGRFVRNLTRDVFSLKEDGIPQTITTFDAEDAPVDVVVAIDISDSMRRAFSGLKKAVLDFLASLKPRDRATVVAFNDRVFVLTRGERDQGALSAALDGIVTRGGTALYDAIVQSLALFESGLTRKALVVFTDGADLSSQAIFGPVEQRVHESDGAVYVIMQGPQSKNARFKEQMDRLAKASGGRAFAADGLEDAIEALGRVHEELANQYLLAYTPPAETAAGFSRITVEVTGNKYSVRAREGYRRR